MILEQKGYEQKALHLSTSRGQSIKNIKVFRFTLLMAVDLSTVCTLMCHCDVRGRCPDQP